MDNIFLLVTHKIIFNQSPQLKTVMLICCSVIRVLRALKVINTTELIRGYHKSYLIRDNKFFLNNNKHYVQNEKECL